MNKSFLFVIIALVTFITCFIILNIRYKMKTFYSKISTNNLDILQIHTNEFKDNTSYFSLIIVKKESDSQNVFKHFSSFIYSTRELIPFHYTNEIDLKKLNFYGYFLYLIINSFCIDPLYLKIIKNNSETIIKISYNYYYIVPFQLLNSIEKICILSNNIFLSKENIKFFSIENIISNFIC